MLFQKRTSANVPAVRGRNSATVRPNAANDVLPHSAENGASADTNNSISVKSAKWTVFPDHVTYSSEALSGLSVQYCTFIGGGGGGR